MTNNQTILALTEEVRVLRAQCEAYFAAQDACEPYRSGKRSSPPIVKLYELKESEAILRETLKRPSTLSNKDEPA